MSNIAIELDSKYRESLDLLKQVIPNEKGEEIQNDSEMLGVLIDSFMNFIQEQAGLEDYGHGDGHCGTGGCGCSH